VAIAREYDSGMAGKRRSIIRMFVNDEHLEFIG
jgi:hypothetical protein